MSRVASILRFVSAAEGRTDGELLDAFRLHRDEAAFTELVRRHGSLVWGVCRRLLPDHADAEDAFQASFLVLVRRAKGLSDRGTVGPWLYKVAAWTARNLRRKNARRLARRSPLADTVPVPPTVPDSRLDIDAALLALPEKYRAPLILCHLEGLSRRAAAERLGCPEGTVSSLLSRGLAKLRVRLAGHEFVLAAVPAVLASSTVRAACATRVAGGASVNHLIEGVLHMLWVKKATAAMTALVVVFAAGIGVGVTVRHGSPAVADEKAPQSGTVKPPPLAPQPDAELNALKSWLKEVTQRRDAALAGIIDTEKRIAFVQTKTESGITPAEGMQVRVNLVRFREEVRQWDKQRDEILGLIQEHETRPIGAALMVVALPGETDVWRVTEYAATGKRIGSLTTDTSEMLRLFVTRSAKDAAAPKELRVVVRDGASLSAAFSAVWAAKEAGFKKVKFTGTIPPKFSIPASSKDLPRHHLEDFETDKLYNELLRNSMKC